MGTYLILVGLLSICSLSFGQECNRELLVNVEISGAEIQHLNSPDAEHCQLLCTQHPSCLFFTFIRADWTRDNRHFYCYLKSTSSGEAIVKTSAPLLGVTSGYSLKPCTPDPEPCLSQVYQNVDFLGADYRSLFTADYEECQRACTQDPACQFFTFINGLFSTPENIRYKCYLKFSWVIPRTPIVQREAGVVSGFSHKRQITQFFDTACQGKLLANTAISGNHLQMLPAASPEHCQTLCSAHPLCTYFSYVSETLTCNLKNNPNEMVAIAKDGVTSGFPARFCQLDNNWVKVAYEGIHFRGSDMRNELTNDADLCPKKCTEDPNCQFYTYANENFSEEHARGRCYFKRVIAIPAPPKVNKLANVVSGFSQRNCVSSFLQKNTPAKSLTK